MRKHGNIGKEKDGKRCIRAGQRGCRCDELQPWFSYESPATPLLVSWTFLPFPCHDRHMETLGQRIRRLREERRLSQAELGDMIDVSGRAVGGWERDEHEPRNSIGALEKVFGVSLTTGEPVPVAGEQDQVVRAIEGSLLNRADRAELISHYWRLFDAQSEAKSRGGDGHD